MPRREEAAQHVAAVAPSCVGSAASSVGLDGVDRLVSARRAPRRFGARRPASVASSVVFGRRSLVSVIVSRHRDRASCGVAMRDCGRG